MPATPPADGRPEPDPDAPAEEIQADIERTRAEVGETAEALAAKLDVPRRVHEKTEEVKERVAETTAPARRNAVPIAVATVAVLLLAAIRRRRRHD